MAEGNRKDESYSSWFGSLLATAKEKSEKAFEMVCNDLDEFTSTMQKDTKKVVDQTKETLKNDEDNKTASDKLKSGFSYLMDGITKALTVEPEDTSPPKTQTAQPDSNIFDRSKARIRAIQVDTGTYLQKPSGPPEKFADWVKSFDLDTKKGDISDLLISMVEVRSLYASLVPSQVSHQEFWQRYFYKVHQLEMDEARKQALMKRADNAQTKEDSISWDDEEWSADEDQPAPRTKEEIENRLKPDSDSTENVKTQDNDKQAVELQHGTCAKNVPAISEDNSGTQSESGTVKEKDTGQTDKFKAETDKNTMETYNEPENEGIKSVEKGTLEISTGDKDSVEQDKKPVDSVKVVDKASVEKQEPSTESADSKVCDKDDKSVKEEVELKTKVKGDMVVVGTERISPSSDLSGNGNKESSSEDWEQDFDIELTEEDMKAAEEVARKLNVSATDYTKLTGDQMMGMVSSSTNATVPAATDITTTLAITASTTALATATTVTIASVACSGALTSTPATASTITADTVSNTTATSRSTCASTAAVVESSVTSAITAMSSSSVTSTTTTADTFTNTTTAASRSISATTSATTVTTATNITAGLSSTATLTTASATSDTIVTSTITAKSSSSVTSTATATINTTDEDWESWE